MTILCIETSTSVCSAAVCKDGEPISQCICREGSNHARLLPRYIQQLLDESKQQGLCIDAVALSEGPGSYTGLRIGTSTAKGLCYGLNIPLIPVPTLEVLCEAAKELSAVSFQPSDILIPMIDARRMEVYTAVNGETKAVVVENEESFSVSGEVYYFGDGAEKCSKIFTQPHWHYIPDIVPEARFVGVLAQAKASKGEGLKANEIAYYEPYYLKEFIAAQSHVKGLK
ncbi:MAG: tRNA (adenosine(37)-N6)-threonylcarbamoyltransferase complex dimerization subunit type 1 TsaB [Paludibacteraceae bacterium]|nr:tRNA (adenosine(37)-N6)-threonylcarbamoyltransferase complex dimerization subunit type 1 TsaB [Paludibacteraceae bacterium]MBQ2189678.1 tRNA (adenosine(37)-N6)-threonylcarbamoyltransferase complex dimerization subunit type 1 TsaB [Paludibacteraceae bacterium]MBQ2520534.1 tRNA (adenosine(37)-N6)-threonylcarbamoyltransferase complex dimerization subunit type 1 TsaB [Paludibacteraceae bacterium]MBQ4018888.1 tRNA (adenosine(37)-N6)-threonylcarbamoyltransferase complex dimerization subunit type 1 